MRISTVFRMCSGVPRRFQEAASDAPVVGARLGWTGEGTAPAVSGASASSALDSDPWSFASKDKLRIVDHIRRFGVVRI